MGWVSPRRLTLQFVPTSGLSLCGSGSGFHSKSRNQDPWQGAYKSGEARQPGKVAVCQERKEHVLDIFFFFGNTQNPTLPMSLGWTPRRAGRPVTVFAGLN